MCFVVLCYDAFCIVHNVSHFGKEKHIYFLLIRLRTEHVMLQKWLKNELLLFVLRNENEGGCMTASTQARPDFRCKAAVGYVVGINVVNFYCYHFFRRTKIFTFFLTCTIHTYNIVCYDYY